jgi:hypothetical protein
MSIIITLSYVSTQQKCGQLQNQQAKNRTERLGRLVGIPASYSGGLRFKPRLGDWLSRLNLSWFPSVPPRALPSIYFSIHYSLINLSLVNI